MVRLRSGSDVWDCLHGEPWGLPRETKIHRQNVLYSAGRLVTLRPPPESSKDGQPRAWDSHWLLAQRLLSPTGGKNSGGCSLLFSVTVWVVGTGFKGDTEADCHLGREFICMLMPWKKSMAEALGRELRSVR